MMEMIEIRIFVKMTMLNMTRVTRVIMITLMDKCQLHGMVDGDEGGGVGIDEDAGPHQV